jgi:hypothetical protein
MCPYFARSAEHHAHQAAYQEHSSSQSKANRRKADNEIVSRVA